MEEKLKEVMAAVLEVSPAEITENASTKTLQNWDSLKHMNLIMAIEDEFNIAVDDEAIADLTSYKALADYLKAKI